MQAGSEACSAMMPRGSEEWDPAAMMILSAVRVCSVPSAAVTFTVFPSTKEPAPSTTVILLDFTRLSTPLTIWETTLTRFSWILFQSN